MSGVVDRADARLVSLGHTLPAPPAPFGAYVPAVQSGSLLFVSGMLATTGHTASVVGHLGRELDIAAGRAATVTAALNVLAVARQHLGTLDRVARVVRLGVYLATAPEFYDQPKVADAASELFLAVFGLARTSARLVFGVSSLPLGSPVELDVIFEVAP